VDFISVLGLEKSDPEQRRRVLLFGRIGCTAMTYQYDTWAEWRYILSAGLMGQLEGGLRGQTAFISIFTEVMSWRESDEVEGYFQQTRQCSPSA